MKEENLLRRRFSLCPTSSTPQKIDPRKLTRNLSFGADHEIYTVNPGKDIEKNEFSGLKDEITQTTMTISKSESKLCNELEKDSSSPVTTLTKKESLKVQKRNYKQEKKRASKELFSALKDPSVVIMADWLKIRGTLKGWTKLWCVIKPGVLLIYKTPKRGQWVGTILLNSCELIERPSKKDGFCFKLFHPLDQSIWAMKGPKGENVGSITQPLPSSYLIFRAPSESDGRCWMDALELALRCSSLLKITSSKQGKDGDLNSSLDAANIGLYSLLHTSTVSEQELFQLNGSVLENSHLENDVFSDKSEKDNLEESENETIENSRKTEESESDHSEMQGDFPTSTRGTTYVEQSYEELGEIGEVSQTETVSEENKGLIWTLLKQLRPGMDLSRVVLPTFILEPRSFLDKLSDYYYHADLLSIAAQEDNAYCCMKQVLRWYLSGFYKKPKGIKKPYNPILGETFRCCWQHPQTNSCTFYIAEQVSHHPPVSAFYVTNRKDGFCINGSILARSKFYGNSLSAILDGKARLTFLTRDEEYTLTMPYAHCKGILYGTMTMELGGCVTIECQKTGYKAELEFKLKPFLGSNASVNMVSGKIKRGEEVQATLDGHWDGDVFINEQKSGITEVFWSPTSEIRHKRLKRCVVKLEEQGEFESERLWQHVTSAINAKDQHKATQEKFVLEDAQRKAARELKGLSKDWIPQLFQKEESKDQWTYKYTDTKPWNCLSDIAQFEKDCVIQTLQRQHCPTVQFTRTAYRRNRDLEPKVVTRDCRHRKTSHQPSNHSANTESSCSTPESVQDFSDNEDFNIQCSHCQNGSRELKDIQAAIASLQGTQRDIYRNLTALNSRVLHAKNLPENIFLNYRCWFILCVLLTCQLFINYVFK
ncbi:oxysterol-binding protein-related protein 5 isoform X2 [Protopterus annectens]|nr:oxysterol-binding protein-related protein 5 isoform X2 [Protopterus annectens]XP_043914938.1 oxysterol-binding protein-related protein 5 isoform X2 [Protopterus annectens]XP_043914939.1 oxysterol-binding protein-related protein 5 isoform X2 [Protopterus annectens]XP_043914940.1 oxysterol-binding protein-related protein 5 isoform X2 [Protopterus annectens]XP_043914941.1 oxysterol-binding protein-related protein 5 isoform X2 [Protopterus annectens]XP_043914943.1 oxysterol-binding protein-rela